MKSTIIKVGDIQTAFESLPTNGTAGMFEVDPSGIGPIIDHQDKLSEHHQGVYQLDGLNNFVISGSLKKRPGYFFFVENGKIVKTNNQKYFLPIDDVMTHAGGLQVADTLLAVGNEQYKKMAGLHKDRSNIRFFDISNPKRVRELRHLKINRKPLKDISSAIGLTRINEQWILAVRGKKNLEFYLLNGDPYDSNSKFKGVSSLPFSTYGFKEYQGINLFWGAEDQLYLFGMPNGSNNDDKCLLFELQLEWEWDQIIGVQGAQFLMERHFIRDGVGPRFKWASGMRFSNAAFNPEQLADRVDLISTSAHIMKRNKMRINQWSASFKPPT